MKSELEQYVIDKLEQLRQKQDISYYMLAKRGGLSYSSVTNMMKKGTTPTIYTIERMCAGLGITVSELFSREELFDNLTEEEKELLILFDEADDRQKKLIVAYAKGLLEKTFAKSSKKE